MKYLFGEFINGMEFFLNVFTRFSKLVTEIFVIGVKGLEPAASCKRAECYHSVSKIGVRENL